MSLCWSGAAPSLVQVRVGERLRARAVSTRCQEVVGALMAAAWKHRNARESGPAGRHLSREHDQHPYPPTSGLPGGGCARAPRMHGWLLARCHFVGAAQQRRRVRSALVSVYVAASTRCQGVGGTLMAASWKHRGSLGLQSRIFPENTVSIHTHQRAGFRVVGVRERLGCMDGRRRDVALMERRSTVAGSGPRW